MTRTTAALKLGATLLLAALAACSETAAPRPGAELTLVEPDTGHAGVPGRVAIHGTGFWLPIRTDLGGGAARAVELAARIGPAALSEVRLEAAGVVTAAVPPTLPPGEYDVALTFPDGSVASRDAAYRVVSPIEAALAVAPGDLAPGEEAAVTITVSSVVDLPVRVGPALAAATPGGAFVAELGELDATLEPRGVTTVPGTLRAAAGAEAGADGALTVTVGWSLAALTDVATAQAAVRLVGPARLEAALTTAPAA
ncbi:MAG TPA: hypothetical protein VGQ83_01830, partial [Polyangia bacterium]